MDNDFADSPERKFWKNELPSITIGEDDVDLINQYELWLKGDAFTPERFWRYVLLNKANPYPPDLKEHGWTKSDLSKELRGITAIILPVYN